ncbi:50S ribosomal protein L29, partial [Dysosmobacter welbionis]
PAHLLLPVYPHVPPNGGAGCVREPGALQAGGFLLSAAQSHHQCAADGRSAYLDGHHRRIHSRGHLPAGRRPG